MKKNINLIIFIDEKVGLLTTYVMFYPIILKEVLKVLVIPQHRDGTYSSKLYTALTTKILGSVLVLTRRDFNLD